MKGNLLYSKSVNLNINLTRETSSQKHLEQCLIKYMGTVAQQSGKHKIKLSTILISWMKIEVENICILYIIIYVSFLKINLFILFIYFWLRWVFVAERGLSLVAASGGYSSLQCVCFSLRWLLLLWNVGSRRVGFSSCGTWAQ